MRISLEEKQRVADRILRAAVTLISKEGFDAVSMRQIAHAAKVGEATVYRYFPNKYALGCAYFAWSHDQTIERLQTIAEFESARFVEQLQMLLYTQLDLYAKDRAFVAATYDLILKGGFLRSSKEINELKDKGLAVVTEMLDAAVAQGEFAEPPMKRTVCRGILDLMASIGYYWIHDESPNYQNTLQLVDKSLGLVGGLLSSNVLGGLADVAQFLFREHIVTQWSQSQLHNFDFSAIKKRFREEGLR